MPVNIANVLHHLVQNQFLYLHTSFTHQCKQNSEHKNEIIFLVLPYILGAYKHLMEMVLF